ncbi:hypothetical protein QBC47DRAFT_368919 [Echria macrotheca]|uniref:Uncharacterized protein n=1 Tax=Echria macrotheca TaxID=438768 RepID=A0AAJ0FGI2_9PEZI|nr:hypothetical protein QBC47DRAFT_368919 [Echria macrotheca]
MANSNANPNPFSQPLTTPLAPSDALTFLQSLLALPKQPTNLEIYRRYCTQQVDLIANHTPGTTLTTYQSLLDTASLLRQSHSRSDLLAQLAKPPTNNPTQQPATHHGPGSTQEENTLHLTARLLTMLRIGEIPHEILGGRHLSWTGPDSLADFVHSYFQPTPILGHELIRFEKTFNALNLVRIANLSIQWTDNLADHLRLVNDDKTLRIFHHAGFLLSQEQNSPLFPDGFVCETLQTLALLFPKYDNPVRAWYRTQALKHGLDYEAVEAGHLVTDDRQAEKFMYWRDRLVVLKQAYDEARPLTIGQWWHDRRNGVQWYTFWVALWVLFLTILFGLVQSIEGAMQVYAAFHPG